MSTMHGNDTEWGAEVELWPESQRDWANLAAGAMVFSDAPDVAVTKALALVRESMASSGQGAEALFGGPVDYGRAVGRRNRAATQVLEGALPFRNAAGAFTALLAGLGLLLVVLGTWTGFADGWREDSFAGPVLLLFPLLFILAAIGVWGWLLRTRGHLRTPWAIWAAVLAGVAGTIALMLLLGGFEPAGPPNWVVPFAGLALVAIGFKLPEGEDRELADDAAWEDERYFTRASNLLRGRYLFTRDQAARALAEARGHRAQSASGTASGEFGNVELFAAQLAAAERTAPKRGIVLRRAGFSLIVAFFGFTIGSAYLEGPVTAWLIVQSAMWLCLAVMVVFSWRPTRINAEATERQDERRADARTLAGDDED